ncbi:MAG: hypothetical protein LBQ76_03895 [Candidatus Fibromonas sp.]|jgi:uncharacterized protein (TIGR02145 family)|nr:hypothetical protein [Candidatus Fibromonas sp.]
MKFTFNLNKKEFNMKKAAIAFLLTCTAVFAQQKGTFKDSRDGKTYNTVKIGNQTWMAENLNYNVKGSKCYGEGGGVVIGWDEKKDIPITKTLSNAEVQANCAKYGRLYTWATAMNIDAKFNKDNWRGNDERHRGICPEGWYLPSGYGGNNAGDAFRYGEWKTLIDFVSNNPGNHGFSTLLGGRGGSDGKFYDIGKYASWWASEHSEGAAYYVDPDGSGGFGHSWTEKGFFFSVRCIRNPTKEEEAADKAAQAAKAEEERKAKAAEAAAREAEKEAARKVPVQLGSFTDPRDKKTYKTVKIDNQIYNQTWMAENLNYDIKGSACWLDKPDYCKKYGRLYNWDDAMKACPSGWHLTKGGEWLELVKFAGGDKTAGKKLMAKSGWDKCKGEKQEYISGNFYKVKYDACGTDDFGFSALPGVPYEANKNMDQGAWWTASENGSTSAYFYSMTSYSEKANYAPTDKSGFKSVRCIKDGGTTPAPSPTSTPAPTPTPAPAPTPTPTPAPAPAPTPAPANNASTTMYCVIYMGGKLTTCTEMKDTKEDKSKCDTQNKGLKMVRGEAKWTATKPNTKCGK